MGKHLVLVGGGHAHMTVLAGLGRFIARGRRATLISTSPFHYYSGMGPGMLSGIYRPQELRFHVKKMVEDRGGTFLKDRVTAVIPQRRTLQLRSGKEVGYDVVSFNTGSEVPGDIVTDNPECLFPVKPIENLLKARAKVIEMAKRGGVDAAVIGGGAAGVEISANLWRLIRDSGGEARISLIEGGSVLSGFSEKAQDVARNILTGKGVTLIEGIRVRSVMKNGVHLGSGETIKSDIVFAAVGVKPSPIFADSGLSTGPDGGLLVNRFLQCVDHPEIFGGGDCITIDGIPLRRVGVYAVRQNPVLYRNLHAALAGDPLRPFDPGGPYLLILNMGDGRGIFWKGGVVFDGRLAFAVKDYIDRRFMKKFQVSGELRQPV
ncbi:MAG: FAD-dependent oxidoreductase [Deltaproteobacteria bacterium]|nr:FAD-dependent oxidoreductase [Deltaproteobacteria bacterium]NIS76699.1 FAD-dependent oxidoreductase [Deltaproteobacteria bacterium]